MQKALKYIFPVILALVIICNIIAAVCFSNFLRQGVHSFAGYTRLDFSQPVYFIDANTNEVFGNSTFTISALAQPKKGDFRGCMSITQYPIALDESYSNYFYTAKYGSIDIMSYDRHDGDEYYWLRMSQEDPSIYAVFINLEDGSSLTAYPGETEEEAIANCQRFWQWFRK